MSATWLKLPLDPLVLRDLKVGQWVNLSGTLYTARDAALKRIFDLEADNKQPPVDLKGQMIYFVGPTPPAPGEAVGAAGPTTSRRMEHFIPALIEAGVSGIMGKGPLSQSAVKELQRKSAIYLAAAGGAGAFYGSKVRGAAVTAYEELGPDAIYCMHIENFPAVVAIDLEGGDLFEQGPKTYRKES